MVNHTEGRCMEFLLNYIREQLLIGEIDSDIEVNVTEEELKKAFTSEEDFDVFIDLLLHRIVNTIKEIKNGKREN